MKVKRNEYLGGYKTCKHMNIMLLINLFITILQIEWYICSFILNILTLQNKIQPINHIQIIFASIVLFFTLMHCALLLFALSLTKKQKWWKNMNITFTYKTKRLFKIRIRFWLYSSLVCYALCIVLNSCNIAMPTMAWIWATAIIFPTILNILFLHFFKLINRWLQKKLYKKYVRNV